MRRLLTALAAIGIAGASLWYLVAPPRDEGAYRDRASDTAETLRSQVETARLWVEVARDGDAPGPAIKVGLEDAESGAQRASAKFLGYVPPRPADRVRAELESIASRVSAQLGGIRIAAERGEWEEVERADPALRRLASRLDAFLRTTTG